MSFQLAPGSQSSRRDAQCKQLSSDRSARPQRAMLDAALLTDRSLKCCLHCSVAASPADDERRVRFVPRVADGFVGISSGISKVQLTIGELRCVGRELLFSDPSSVRTVPTC